MTGKEETMKDRRRCEKMPFDHVFWVDGREELCHATGWQVLFEDGIWWNEYIDSTGEYQYGG